MEWLLCILLIAITGIWFAAKAGFQERWVWALLVFFGASVTLGAMRWNSYVRHKASVDEQTLNAIPRADRDEDFASSDTCQACHPSQYASWHESFHRTMTQVASAESVRGKFDDVTLELMGKTYQLSRSNSQFWVDIFEPVSAGGANDQRVPATRASISMLTGSHHQQVYWTSTGPGNRYGSRGATRPAPTPGPSA